MLAIEILLTELQMTERPTPKPSDSEVLIKVAAAGINRPDVFQRLGNYPPPPGASDIPGLEVSGEIIEIGTKVNQWQPGDKVCALLTGGGYAEYALAPATQCLPIPDGLTDIEAAALPETFFTVWHNLYDRASLKSGETLLVHGGASGIGTTAIQMATALGSPVLTTASSDHKCRACEQLGATLAINYKDEDFVEAVLRKTEGVGADVILDMVGGDYIQRNLKAAAIEGRIVSVAFLQGAKTTVNLMPMLLKRLTLSGSTLRTQPIDNKTAIAKSLKEQVWPLVETGSIKPVIDSVYELADADKAHAHMESNQHIGKIVLRVSA